MMSPACLRATGDFSPKNSWLTTACGAGDALALIGGHRETPYAVIVSDIRMPEMDGVQFLSRVRSVSSDSVRIALTGYADMQSAIDAVNQGAIFRFLTKPCEKEVLAKALTAGLLQHRLVIAEKELLEKTLHGSVCVLTEMLALANPAALSCGERIARYVRCMTDRLEPSSPWQYELAAMMSQLGCLTLDNDTLAAVYAGKPLAADELERYAGHPAAAEQLLSNIPRLEAVAHMIGRQSTVSPSWETGRPDAVTLGAQMLRVAIAYDRLLMAGNSHDESFRCLCQHPDEFALPVVNALSELEAGIPAETRICSISDLECGMVLHEDVCSFSGMLLVAKGQRVSNVILARLRNFLLRGAISGAVCVGIPPPQNSNLQSRKAQTAGR